MASQPRGPVVELDDVADQEHERIRVAQFVRLHPDASLVENKLVFSPPKRGKTRSVPLPSRVARELDDA